MNFSIKLRSNTKLECLLNMLEKLVRDKRYNLLLRKFVNYRQEMFYKIGLEEIVIA